MMNDSSPQTMRGSLLDQRYELDHLLGKGSGGRVYRARQRSTGQAVAVKILDPEQDERPTIERQKQRFRREMTICGRLSHPDIVRLIDFGEVGDSLYSVFELVPGRTLAQLLQADGTLSVRRSMRLARQLLQVLVYSHAQGVIHRDLKPSNLMVLGEGDDERMKVLDFGVSALSGHPFSAFARLTLSNEMVGTPAYAAPEQLRGDSPTAKSDLYAWGLILLECLTGECAMGGVSLGEIFQRQLSPAAVELPLQLRDHALGTLLRWVLEKTPARRAGAAQDVLSKLDAISVADLANESGFFVDGAGSSQSAAGAITRTTTSAHIEGERRQVSALCWRLELRCTIPTADAALLEAYRGDLFALCQATVEAQGATWVAGFGDLSLFYFGLPRSKETDARMALRSALELAERLRVRSQVLRAQSDVTITFRAGLHAGVLTAGDRKHDTQFAHGLVAATALALVEREVPGAEFGIVASHSFRQLTGRFGQFGDAREVPLRWTSVPLVTYPVLGEVFGEAFERDGAPMIGREGELLQLDAALTSANEHGCAVLVQAEAGLGKSRLAHDFARMRAAHGQAPLMMRCLPELEPIALGPVLELVTSELGLRDLKPLRCAQVAEALAGFALETGAVALLCTWLSVPLTAPYTPLPQSPQLQRVMLNAVLGSLVRQLAQRAGYLLVEDLHWADHRTREWLAQYCAALSVEGGFALVTTRPETVWNVEPLPRTITLAPLDDGHVSALLAALPAARLLPQRTLDAIVARADGVPLFVEELARALSEPNALSELREVPATLHDLLKSRLDALGPTQETAQFAAAIGREFDVPLLRASIGKDEATLLADVDQLISAGLVLVRRQVAQSSYLFRHALVRDAAYESLTPAARLHVHGLIADALTREFAEQVAARPDVVARHLERASRPFESQARWLASGQLAMRDTTYDEARERFERGLSQVQQCGAVAGRDDAELDQLNALLAAHVVKLGFGAPALPGILERAQRLIDRGLASPQRTLPLYWGQYLFNTARPQFERALPIARTMLDVASACGDRHFMLAGHSALVRLAFWSGRFDDAANHYRQIDLVNGPALGRQLLAIIGEDSYTAASSFAALSAIIRGDADAGIAKLEQLVRDEEKAKIPGQTEGSMAQAAFGYLLRGMDSPHGADLSNARAIALRARDSAGRLGFPFWAGYAGLIEASARVYLGDPSAVEEIRATMQGFAAAGADIGFGWNHGTIARGLIQRGELDAAAQAIAAAKQHIARSGEEFFAVELLRLEARLVQARRRGDPAALHALRMATSDKRGATLFVARATADLEHLLHA
jgi:TOMM system kinase/cyclase fusion protein